MDERQKAEILHVLKHGTFEIEGLLPWSSNYAFLGRVCGLKAETAVTVEFPVVYKPRHGERPLWDFPQGSLCAREQAAFVVSEALSWEIVPPTVLRDAEHGIGSVQYFIEHDPERHYFTFEGDPDYADQLQKIVLFDVIINNADRKSGHVLIENVVSGKDGETAVLVYPGRLWGIDHGICFHVDPKLRTVIWEFAGQPIPEQQMEALAVLHAQLNQTDTRIQRQLNSLLKHNEIAALALRLTHLLQQGKFPNPGPGRHYPWPPV